MRTGTDYLHSLRDTRHVWMMGSGRIDDPTTHPATCAMAPQYATWYDRHFDAAWRGGADRLPLA